MRFAYRVFRSKGFSDTQVESTATEAAAFASSLDCEQVVNVSHVLDGHIHIITVWYWESSAEQT
jgi:hypothetical protein